MGRRRVTPPPGPPGAPVIGCLRELRADPLALFAGAVARYGGVVSIPVAHRRVYLLSAPEAIARVAVTNRANYVKGISYEALRVPIGDALLTADGELWRRRKRRLLPLFSRRALLAQVPTVVAAAEAFADAWAPRAAAGQAFDVVPEMNRLAFDVIGRILLGTALGAAMRDIEGDVAEASEWVARRTRALVPLPVGLPTPRNRRFAVARRRIERFADGVIAGGRAGGRGGGLVDLLVDDSDGEEPLDDEALRREVIALLMAGHQTTGAALAWTWHVLAHAPAVADAVAAEAAAVLGDGPVGAPELDRLTYTEQVVKEVMRLHPPGWAFTRTPLADDEVCGHRLPAGAVVLVSPYANHRDPRRWEEPERFDPERFEPARAARRPPHAFIPFGVGSTACIGKQLAMMETKLVVATLARRFRFAPAGPARVRATPGITLMPRDPVLVRLLARDG